MPNDVKYTIASPAEREQVVDFANYVFSQAHRPHDFKTLCPKVFADHVKEDPATHFIARRSDGHIRAMVDLLPLELKVLDKILHVGCVGDVSVHPYARGEGHMKELMGMMMDSAKERRMDMLVLGGQRQRYGYFGFDHGGYCLCFEVTATNIRHCLRNVNEENVTFTDLTEKHSEEVDFAHVLAASRPVAGVRPRESFLDIMHSWNSRCRLIRVDGAPVGYVMGCVKELALTDEELLPRVLKAMFIQDELQSAEINVFPHEKRRMEILSGLCESSSIGPVEMISVLDWTRTLDILLRLKASYAPLEDGRAVLGVDAERFAIEVRGGVPSVRKTEDMPDRAMEHLEAVRKFFGVESLLASDPLFKNWLPVPFVLPGADTF